MLAGEGTWSREDWKAPRQPPSHSELPGLAERHSVLDKRQAPPSVAPNHQLLAPSPLVPDHLQIPQDLRLAPGTRSGSGPAWESDSLSLVPSSVSQVPSAQAVSYVRVTSTLRWHVHTPSPLRRRSHASSQPLATSHETGKRLIQPLKRFPDSYKGQRKEFWERNPRGGTLLSAELALVLTSLSLQSSSRGGPALCQAPGQVRSEIRPVRVQKGFNPPHAPEGGNTLLIGRWGTKE